MPARRAGPRSGISVYIETGAKRTFACAVDWPGWSRSGRDEASALEALCSSAPRYAHVVGRSRLGFRTPPMVASFHVVERLRGNVTTDFGAPGVPAHADVADVSDTELRRLRALLEAGWRAFDEAVRRSRGKTLARGPRGGGRDLDAIVRHVGEAEAGYLSALGWPFASDELTDGQRARRRAVLDGLAASARGEIAARGPRGGVRWRPRFFVRRLAWHTLDHLWEIEDRVSR